MFDIGFWELTAIGVIALLVVGPERLPGMARTLGLWVGRIRRYVSHVRDDIEREIHAEELRDLMKESGKLNSIGESLTEAGQVVDEFKREIESADRAVTEEDTNKAIPSADEPPSAIDAAATGVGEAVTGGKAHDPAANDAAENSAASDQKLSTDEQRSG